MAATTLQLRRGTTAQHATFTGAAGEVTVDTTKKTAVVHDGATPGGFPLAGISGFPTVPTSFVGQVIAVTAPHLRHMVWNGTAYVRAPWHQPGMVMHSYDNPATIPGYLPVRADVTYNQVNYPDLISRLGLSGTGTFALIEARGEFLRVLDNGRGIDTSRGLGTAQLDASQYHAHNIQSGIATALGAAFAGVVVGQYIGTEGMSTRGMYASDPVQLNSHVPPRLAEENRPRNIALPLWVSY